MTPPSELAPSSYAPSVNSREKRGRVGRTSLGRRWSRSEHKSRNPDSADCTPVGERSMAPATLPFFATLQHPSDRRGLTWRRGSGLEAYERRAAQWNRAPSPRRSAPSSQKVGMFVLPRATLPASNSPKSTWTPKAEKESMSFRPHNVTLKRASTHEVSCTRSVSVPSGQDVVEECRGQNKQTRN